MALSAKAQRRWDAFRAHRIGYYSLLASAVLFTLTLFAEFLANDDPLLVRYKDQFYFPIFEETWETEFGGDFEIATDFADPYLREKIEQDGFILFPPIPYDYRSIVYDLDQPSPSPPSWQNLLGTDDQSRDVAARVVYGFRISILFGFTLTIASAIIGVVAGAIQGYYGGWTDLLLQRFMEIWSSMPILFILIILASIVAPTFWILLGIVLLFQWLTYVPAVRAEFLRGRNFEYVLAARAMGMRDSRLMFKHILPNAMVATLSYMPFTLSGSVVILTGLDFLGFGLPPGDPSLGELLAQGKANLQAPWLGITAFVSLALLMVLLIFIGEAVRDAFDPRAKQ